MDESASSSKRPPPDEPPPPPPKMMAMASPNVQAYAQNLELQAEIQGIREEMRKQQKQQEIAQELQNRLLAANTNPRTEIIRELQTIVQPTIPVPQAPPQHDDLMQAFQQAMANQNHQLGRTLERMGMSMAEFVEHMKEKDKKPMEDAVVVGSSQPPPPGPPQGAAPIPIRAKSRSRSARPEQYTIATPRAQQPPASREPSLASTVRYPSPEAEPPRAQIARTVAREELGRSRSRGGTEVILPIEEEGPRGRSATRKPEGPMANRAKALLKKQEHGVTIGETKIHLGKFAKNFAQVVKQKGKNIEKATSVPPPPKQKTYDDIEKEIEEAVQDPTDTRLRKKPQFPAGAFIKRERLDSEGRKSLRYQGMPIRV